MAELQPLNNVQVKIGEIQFPGYSELKEQAMEVAKIIRQTEVTEETIKEAKKLLAAANKSVRELEDRRIGVKRQMMVPYLDFEDQVKEIVNIVKDADQEIRSKVRELEELERDQKEQDLRDIWEMRMRPYSDDLSFLDFEDWLEPSYLNKSVSMTKLEDNMANFLNSKHSDFKAIQSLENPIDILNEYTTCLDMAESIRRVNGRIKAKEELNKVYGKPENQPKQKVTIFYIEDETQANFAEMLLKQNNITFIKERK